MLPHPIHFDADCTGSIAEYLDPSYHFVFKLVCKDYKAVLPGKTKSVSADYTSSVILIHWALTNGCSWDDIDCDEIAYRGHLEVLQWAHANGCPTIKLDSMCMNAAIGGHLEVLKWARANGWSWGNTLSLAAEGGHLKIMQWALTNGCPLDRPCEDETCSMAAKGGHLEVLKWARDNGCPWDEETCLMAAGYGHSEVLQWARANGCPWNSTWWEEAAKYASQWEEKNGIYR